MISKKSISKMGVIFAFLFFSTGFASAGTILNWNLVLEHDGSGAVISGSLDDLIAAINNGADVKVINYGNWTGAGTDNISVRTSSNGVLSVSYNTGNPIVSLQNKIYYYDVAANGTSILTEDSMGISVFGTNGIKELLEYNASGDSILSHIYRNDRMKWFISN